MIRLSFDKESYDFDVAQKIVDIMQEESIESCKRLSLAFGFFGDEWMSVRVGRTTEPITVKIFTRNIRAFITEFGYGSEMAGADENPFLTKYMNDSKAFNQERKSKGNAILRRGKDPFTTLNWEGGENALYVEKLGGSEPKGENLEGQKVGLYKRGGIVVTPRKGKFILKAEMLVYRERVIERIQNYFQDELDISKYITGGD